MANHYVVTAHKPTAVTACVTGKHPVRGNSINNITFLHRQFYFARGFKPNRGEEHPIGNILSHSGRLAACQRSGAVWESSCDETLSATSEC